MKIISRDKHLHILLIFKVKLTHCKNDNFKLNSHVYHIYLLKMCLNSQQSLPPKLHTNADIEQLIPFSCI